MVAANTVPEGPKGWELISSKGSDWSDVFSEEKDINQTGFVVTRVGTRTVTQYTYLEPLGTSQRAWNFMIGLAQVICVVCTLGLASLIFSSIRDNLYSPWREPKQEVLGSPVREDVTESYKAEREDIALEGLAQYPTEKTALMVKIGDGDEIQFVKVEGSWQVAKPGETSVVDEQELIQTLKEMDQDALRAALDHSEISNLNDLMVIGEWKVSLKNVDGNLQGVLTHIETGDTVAGGENMVIHILYKTLKESSIPIRFTCIKEELFSDFFFERVEFLSNDQKGTPMKPGSRAEVTWSKQPISVQKRGYQAGKEEKEITCVRCKYKPTRQAIFKDVAYTIGAMSDNELEHAAREFGTHYKEGDILAIEELSGQTAQLGFLNHTFYIRNGGHISLPKKAHQVRIGKRERGIITYKYLDDDDVRVVKEAIRERILRSGFSLESENPFFRVVMENGLNKDAPPETPAMRKVREAPILAGSPSSWRYL